MFGSVPFTGATIIEKVHGLKCTGISLHERFALSTAEYLSRMSRLRTRQIIAHNQPLQSFMRNQMSFRMRQQQGARIQPVKQRLGMPGLRRFGSEGNLPGLRRSNSFSQLTNRIPWNTFRSPSISRAGSVSNVSNASWHGGTRFVRRRGNAGQNRGPRQRGRQRGRQQLGQLRQHRLRATSFGQNRAGNTPRGRGRGRGGVYRNQQYRKNFKKNENQQNNNQTSNQSNRNQTNNQPNRNQNQNHVKMLTKEELDAQLDQYMALSERALDKELDDYMMKGALMDFDV